MFKIIQKTLSCTEAFSYSNIVLEVFDHRGFRAFLLVLHNVFIHG